MDELQQLLNALGASTFAEALTMINRFNAFVTDARVATATDDLTGASAAITANATALRQLEAATGKKGGEAIATALAWKQGAEDAEKAREELKAAKDAQAKADAMAKLDEAVESGRLAPANRQQFEDLFTNFGVGALEAAISALPKATTQTPTSQSPAQPTSSQLNTLTAEDKQVAEQMGLSEKDMLEAKQKYPYQPGQAA